MRHLTFHSLDDSLCYRFDNSGFPPIATLVVYGSEIGIPAEEVAALEHKMRPIGLACILANDYWNFGKEMRAFERGLGYLVIHGDGTAGIEWLMNDDAKVRV
jgi:hypothetical protein